MALSRATVQSNPYRLVIEHVSPSVDGGRYPVKRIVGDDCTVGADIIGDGHDQLGARVRYRGPKSRSWRTIGMRYDYDSDRWYATLPLSEIGRWRFTIEAWTNRFGTWLGDLRKKVDAGVDISVDLLEGASLIDKAVIHAAPTRQVDLADAAQHLADTSVPERDRIAAAFDPQLAALMDGVVDDLELTRLGQVYEIVVDRAAARFAAWYEMFPRSQGTAPGKPATFHDAARRLPRLAELGFDVIYLPPIHPIGTTFRKGRNGLLAAEPGDPGSPWAIGSADGGHTAVAPELGGMAGFRHFVAVARDLGMEVALDYALQCSPDHPWVKQHPEWFVIRPDGTIKYAENPPKKYQDIYPLDFWCEEREQLWQACKETLEFWIEQGIQTFRVDNPHTKPLAFWEWLINGIKEHHPEVVFLSEAFTRPKRMLLLAKLGFTQSYTHFTWKNTSYELRELFTELNRADVVDYFRGNLFTNTPDILHEYLQRGGRPAFRVRLILAATLSPLYGIYSGFELCENVPREAGSEEYLNSEKYEIRVRDWDAPGNINEDLRLINEIRRANPALQSQGNVTFHGTDNDMLLCYSRTTWGNDLLIVVNLDPHGPQTGMVDVDVTRLGLPESGPYTLQDLLTGQRYEWRGRRNYVSLDPQRAVAHVLRVER